MGDDFDKTMDAVGLRLKNLRLHRNITLSDLAAETAISSSTLSRLEAGLRRPTLEQLLPLARFYGVTLDSLVDAPQSADPRIDLRPVSCGDGAVVIPLTRRPGGIQAHKFVRPRAQDGIVGELRSHEGHDWAYVLNGTLRLVLGSQDLVLRAGEAVEFDTRTPHWFGSTTSGSVEYLSLFGRQGERAHVRGS